MEQQWQLTRDKNKTNIQQKGTQERLANHKNSKIPGQYKTYAALTRPGNHNRRNIRTVYPHHRRGGQSPPQPCAHHERHDSRSSRHILTQEATHRTNQGRTNKKTALSQSTTEQTDPQTNSHKIKTPQPFCGLKHFGQFTSSHNRKTKGTGTHTQLEKNINDMVSQS